MSLITRQGKQYLVDKEKTYRRVKPNLDLIEGFDNKHDNKVTDRNKVEIKELEDMQNSYNTLMSKWGHQYKIVLKHIKNPQMKKCVKHCLTENNIDKQSACLLGCSTGKFANSSVDQRITNPNDPTDVIAQSDAVVEMIPFLGPFLAMAQDSEMHAEDDITASHRPPSNSTLVENFESKTNNNSTDAATAAFDADIGLENGYNTKIGATVNAPKTYYGGAEGGSGAMGSYGPNGYDDVGKKTTGDMINRYLASDPEYGDQYYYDTSTGRGGNIVEETDSTGYNTNPGGLRAIGQSAMTAVVAQVSQNFGNQPLVKQMEATNVDKEVLDSYLNQMRATWKNMLEASCKSGIGGFGKTGPFNEVDTKQFAGHTQHCSAWVNTAENRSGYPFNKKGKPFTVDLGGDKTPFKLNTIPLSNVSPYGCDTPIPGGRSSNDVVGGAGYCICENGKKIYADGGHPSFTCNAVCAPENENLKPLLYHNTKNWEAPQGFSYGKWVQGNPIIYNTSKVEGGCSSGYTLERHDGQENQGDVCKNKEGKTAAPDGCAIQKKAPYSVVWGTGGGWPEPPGQPCRVRSAASEEVEKQGGDFSKDTTGSFCGTFNKKVTGDKYRFGDDGVNHTVRYTAINNPPPCPTGMVVESGYPKKSINCKKEDTHTRNTFGEDTTITKLGEVLGYERKCKYAAPPGYDKPLINHISKIKPLPTQEDLKETCSSVPFESTYIDILELNLLGYLLQQKAAVIYKTIRESYSGSRAAALKNSAVGKKILKNMNIYEKAYKKLQADKSKKGIMSALFEDVSLKKGSTNISYYIWLTLAIGGTAFALRRFNS